MNDIVALVALEDVVAAAVRDDVVAGAAFDVVDTVAAFEPVIAAVAPERVVADAGDEDVVACGAAENDMVYAGVLEVVRIRARRSGVIPNNQRNEGGAALAGIISAVNAKTGELIVRVGLENPGRC